MKKILMLAIFISLAYRLPAQMIYTLDDCMRYAVENNYMVQKQIATLQNTMLDHTASWLNILPSVDARVGANMNFGRGIDPATNSYINTSTFNNAVAINGSLPIFAGFSGWNKVRSAKMAKLRGQSQLQLAMDQAALQVMIAYVEVIYRQELLALCSQRVDNYRLQELKIMRKCEYGSGSESDLAQIRATLSDEECREIQARNLATLSLMRLKDCMNYPIDDTLNIEMNLQNSFLEQPNQTIVSVVESAKEFDPKVMIAAQTLNENMCKLKIARGAFYPTIQASAGVSTDYFMSFGNKSARDFDTWGMQFKNNAGQYIGLFMAIPIFNGLSTRLEVCRMKNNFAQSHRDLQQVQRELDSQIRQCIQELEACDEQWLQSQKNVDYHILANQAVRRKYDKGMISIIDLQISDDLLFSAKAELLNNYLRRQIKIREVNYYKGIPYIN